MKVTDSLLAHFDDVLAEPDVDEVVSDTSRAGELIGGRYRLIRLLGSGGMGTVYEAEDGSSARVAIKLLSACDAAAQARFAREAALLTDLAHPRIVRALDYGVDDDGPTPFLVTELLDGITLGDRLARGAITAPLALRVVELVCEPLAMLHERGIVHRDLKPSNVFLQSDVVERLVLLDFGLARALEDDDDLTFTGSTLGTPGYIAPEASSGEGLLDPRLDVFALGALLLECVGEKPGAYEVNDKRDRDPVLAVIARLVDRFTAVDPSERPENAHAVAIEVDRALRELGLRLRDDAAFAGTSDAAPDWTVIEAALQNSTPNEHAAAMGLAGRWLHSAGVFDEGDLARGLELAGVPSRAAVWYRRAAQASLRESAFDELFERVESAIRCGATDAQLGGLHLLQAQALGWALRPKESVKHGEEAMRRLGVGSVAYLRAAAEIGVASGRLGDGDRVEEMAAIVGRALDARAPRWIVASAARLVPALCTTGRLPAARALSLQLEAIVDRAAAGDPFVRGRVALARSGCALFDGDLEAHAELLEVAAGFAGDAGDRRAVLHDGTNLAFAWLELGRIDDAEDLIERTLPLAIALGVPFTATLAKKNSALVNLARGRFHEAERWATEAAHEAGENRRLASVSYAFAAFAAVRVGMLDRAETAAKRAYELAPSPVERARALGAAIELGLAKGDLGAVCALAKELDAILEDPPVIDGGEVLTWLSLASAKRRLGDPTGAISLLVRALGRVRARADRIRDPKTRGTFLAMRDNAILVRSTFRIFFTLDP